MHVNSLNLLASLVVIQPESQTSVGQRQMRGERAAPPDTATKTPTAVSGGVSAGPLLSVGRFSGASCLSAQRLEL